MQVNNKKRVILVALALGGAVVLTCDREKPLAPGSATGQLEIEVRWPAEKLLIATYDSLVVTVSGGGIAPIRKVIPVVGKRVSWAVEKVPVGLREVAVEVFGHRPGDSQAVVLYQGSDNVNVLKGKPSKASVDLRPPKGTVWVRGGSLWLNADTLVVEDTLWVEIRGVTSSHTRPLFRWDWGDITYSAWTGDEKRWHVYGTAGTYTVRAEVRDSIDVSEDGLQKLDTLDGLQKLDTLVLVLSPARLKLVQEDPLSFGEVKVDSVRSLLRDVIRNEGDLSGTVQVSVEGDTTFKIDQTVLWVAPDSTAAVRVSFAPTKEDSFSGMIVFEGIGRVALSGKGVQGNRPPLANAGDTLRVLVGSRVTLVGTGSKDPDSTQLTYSWSQVRGPATELSDPNSPTPITTPLSEGKYAFQLIVSDGELTDADTVVVEAVVLVANTGPDTLGPDTLGAWLEDGQITLDGRGSQPQTGSLAYYWTQVRNEADLLPSNFRKVMKRFVDISIMGTLSDNKSPSADLVTFTPTPGRGLYVFTLIVEDIKTKQPSNPDTLYVFVRRIGEKVPVADAGADTMEVVVEEGEVAMGQLDASKSFDENRDQLSYRWRVPAGVTLNDTTVAKPTFTAHAEGVYPFVLVVNDGENDSRLPDTVVVRVVWNYQPVAEAGEDAEVAVEAGAEVVVQLDGSGSDADGDSLNYRWSQVSGPRVALSDSLSVSPTFVAREQGEYAFSLVVNDGRMDSAPDMVEVEVVWNHRPVADAGADTMKVEVKEGEVAVVQLDGSGSDADGDSLNYRWSQVSGSVGIWSEVRSVRPTFRAPMEGAYVVSLVVNDGRMDSAPDMVMIRVILVPPPLVADAGKDQEVETGDQVQLDGSRSFVVLEGSSGLDGEQLTFRWSQVSGPQVVLSDSLSVSPTFVAKKQGEYAFSLVISYGRSDSNPDTVAIRVIPPPLVADAGKDQEVETGDQVQLDGSRSFVVLEGSSGLDGEQLTFRWSQVSGPQVVLSDSLSVSPTFVAKKQGEYAFSLVISYGRSDSNPDTVAIRVITAKMEFVWIEPGTFTMGSPPSESGRNSDEGPQLRVTISKGFYLGKSEITQGQWEAVMGTSPWSGDHFAREAPNNPAVDISWDDVQEFIQKLNDAVGEVIYRLPTEAEWEYACRAGTTTQWSFGNDEEQLWNYAWYKDNAWDVGLRYAQPVGMKLPNPWGLYDMHGNVWEWVQDSYGNYPTSSQIDPAGPENGPNHIMRGGNFIDSAQDTRSANRGIRSHGDRYNNLGARLVRTK